MMPIDCSGELFVPGGAAQPGTPYGRNWAPSNATWAASELYAQPAYWDDVPLERYGQTVNPAAQPFISAAYFFGNFFLIPYKLGIDGTHDRIYTLGYYRPGSETPPLRQRLPLDGDATLYEAGTWIGIFLLLP